MCLPTVLHSLGRPHKCIRGVGKSSEARTSVYLSAQGRRHERLGSTKGSSQRRAKHDIHSLKEFAISLRLGFSLDMPRIGQDGVIKPGVIFPSVSAGGVHDGDTFKKGGNSNLRRSRGSAGCEETKTPIKVCLDTLLNALVPSKMIPGILSWRMTRFKIGVFQNRTSCRGRLPKFVLHEGP
jgi:hypothetical protein